MCFVWFWEQTAIISLYNINWLTETECVYCAVRTGFLTTRIIQINSYIFKGLNARCLRSISVGSLIVSMLPARPSAHARGGVTNDICKMKQSPCITESTSRIWLPGLLSVARTAEWRSAASPLPPPRHCRVVLRSPEVATNWRHYTKRYGRSMTTENIYTEFLLYLATFTCHFPLPHRPASGRSDEWPMIIGQASQ